MSAPILGTLCIVGMLLMIALRMPVALAMAVTGFVGFGLIRTFDASFAILDSGPFEVLSNYGFSPIPMFIFMGVLASKARMSAELFAGARALFGGWRGGMALAAVSSCDAGSFPALVSAQASDSCFITLYSSACASKPIPEM